MRATHTFRKSGRAFSGAIGLLACVVPFLTVQAAPAADAAEKAPWETRFTIDTAALRKAADAAPAAEGVDAEILFKDASYTLDASGRCVYRERTVIRILSEAGVEAWAQLERQWAPWYQDRPQLRARVIGKDGKAHELDPKTVAEGPAGDESLELYSDRRLVRAPLPSLAPGSLIEEEVEVHDRQPEFDAGSIHHIALISSSPIRRARVTVEAPASRPPAWKVRGLSEADVRREETGGLVRLTYEGGPFPVFENWESGMPEEDRVAPRFTFTTGRSWQEVAARYASIVDERIAGGAVPATARDVAAATPSASTRPAWSQTTSRLHRLVRYTGVEFGDATIVPAQPSETVKRGFGDCKDKAVLLAALLRAEGIPARVALLSAGSGPDIEPTLPGLGMFNHAIVVIDGKERVWIDATDEYGMPGQLPEADQGRLALIADAATRELVRTPRSEARDNGLVQTREFFLSERGPARLVVTTEPYGAEERDYRQNYHRTQRKDLEKQMERIAASVYLAKKIGRLEYPDPLEFSTRFSTRLEVPEASRGITDENEAIVALLPSEWVASLPATLQGPSNDAETAEEEKTGSRRRKHDFVWSVPFTMEWRYRIVPPDGFVPAGLPESGQQPLGAATLSREYRVGKDGVIVATIRMASGKPRMSAAEVEETRAASARLSREGAIFVRLQSVGARHMAAGRIREALTEYRRLSDAHPKEALHHTQIARSLLSAGLGEAARRQARLAIETEKDSALAERALGWILQHDLLGRRFGKGFDRAGAVAAYRRAIALETDNEDGRANLAILLEHDAEGERYGDPAQVREAVVEYRKLKQVVKAKTYDINLLIALLRSEQYAEARKFGAELPQEPQRNQILLAAIGASEGAEAAIREAGRFSTDPEPRRLAIENAGRVLLLVRSYVASARLLSEAAAGASKPGVLLTQAEAIGRMRRFEEMKLPPGEPETAVRKLFLSLLLGPRSGVPSTKGLFTRSARESAAEKTDAELAREFRSAFAGRAAGVPPAVILDAAFPAMTLNKQGSEAAGYRINISGSPEMENLVFYVRKDEGEYRIAALTGSLGEMGSEALARAATQDLAGARQWLDWAREDRQAGGGDDPLGGPLLPRFWTKGETASLPRVRLAAAALACADAGHAKAAGAVFDEPVAPENKDLPTDDTDLAKATCAVSLKKSDELHAIAGRLLQKHPGSATAFRLEQIALSRLAKWDEAEKSASDRLKLLPDDPIALEMLTSVRLGREDYKGVEAACLALIARGKASRMIYNNLAWNFLFTSGITDKAIEYAQQASGNAGSRDSAALHTLATLYAEVGRSVQAREALLESLEVRGRDEPEPHDWYVLGRIAENYGEMETARDDYRRVIPPEDSRLGGSTYLLARKRLAVLGKS
jgi:transglutaminase-like putative cysteine protease/tetratricopeptide (TPR) repeat protein